MELPPIKHARASHALQTGSTSLLSPTTRSPIGRSPGSLSPVGRDVISFSNHEMNGNFLKSPSPRMQRNGSSAALMNNNSSQNLL